MVNEQNMLLRNYAKHVKQSDILIDLNDGFWCVLEFSNWYEFFSWIQKHVFMNSSKEAIER